MKKNAVGFECRLCPSMAKERKNLINHLKEKHKDYLNSTKMKGNEKSTMQIETIKVK
jgi:hypothetical protein